MRTELTVLALAVALAGCASAPAGDRVSSAGTPVVAAPGSCVPPRLSTAGADLCAYPADVRAFVEDRDACDHFRGEPWPETDSDADRARRRALVEGVRTACAGTDRRLADLRARYRDDARVIALLAPFEERIED
ncbi:hypothetical protein [Lysobacter humi (ex Lee et al. 2017)]